MLRQMEEERVSYLSFLLLLCFLLPISAKRAISPCRTISLYFHDIIYDGGNMDNATSAIVASPVWTDLLRLDKLMSFGDIVVFDDPVTLDNNLHSPPVGRAQGLYFYVNKKVPTAWFAFSFVLNYTDYKGTIDVVGYDPPVLPVRDLSVVGGTGDFFMTRGTATFATDAFEGHVYFRLRVDIKLYECY